jgi:methylmalonyl-CoA mutase cobalamin-binding domain/chain
MIQLSDEPRHPIQVVTRRTGLSADVLRAWERRYHAVVPSRTASKRRLYSDRDIERLVLLKRATDGGRSIGQVAGWNDSDLRTLVLEDRSAEATAIPMATGEQEDDDAQSVCQAALAAIEALDAKRLQRTLEAASLNFSPSILTELVLVPVMRTVGARWAEGTLGIPHEHMASAIVRNLLSSIVLSRNLPGSGPCIVIATPARQIHEMGGLVVAATAASAGWDVTYLGADLPHDAIAAAAVATDARAVALSITHPADDERLPDELRALRSALPARTVLLVGGLASAAYAEPLADSGALLLQDTASLRAILGSLRSENGGSTR